ncbi:hypothetical protein T01_7258 [Trichinella spiralis]|uniref:Uncharacterized protein n=1 Tax=Trichinella spiralis TaxID=6334 RepID=A0A0V1BMN7_TRISP|nr:hypothetical protein T01_7258 [Trichinella spiralis]
MRRRLFCQSALRIKSRTIIDGHVENDQDVVNSTKDNVCQLIILPRCAVCLTFRSAQSMLRWEIAYHIDIYFILVAEKFAKTPI